MNQTQQNISGVYVPMWVLQSDNLSQSDKLVYACIAIWEVCYLPNEQIANYLQLSERTVSQSIQKLQEMQIIFVEFVGDNSAKRRIYRLMDKPNKLKYLISKGLIDIEKFSTGLAKSATLDGGVSKICEGGSKICEPLTGERVEKFATKEINKEEIAEAEQKPNAESPAVNGRLSANGSGKSRPKRKDFASDEEFERAFYAFKG